MLKIRDTTRGNRSFSYCFPLDKLSGCVVLIQVFDMAGPVHDRISISKFTHACGV